MNLHNRVNETLFAICSNDVLFQLTQEENNLNLEGQQRLSRLAGHILKQQSFAPHFPPNANGFSQVRKYGFLAICISLITYHPNGILLARFPPL